MANSDQNPRLAEIARGIAADRPAESLTDGRGFRMWETRRANLFKRAVGLLCARAGDAELEALRLAAHELSDHLATPVPLLVFAVHGEAGALNLPRGYRLLRNGFGEISLELAGVLFAPAFSDPEPDRASVERLREDLRTGLIAEIRAYLAEMGAI